MSETAVDRARRLAKESERKKLEKVYMATLLKYGSGRRGEKGAKRTKGGGRREDEAARKRGAPGRNGGREEDGSVRSIASF